MEGAREGLPLAAVEMCDLQCVSPRLNVGKGGEVEFIGQAVASAMRQEMLYMALRALLRVGLNVA